MSNKDPIFSGPNGRKRERMGRMISNGNVVQKNDSGYEPKVGDMIEFSDAPGQMFKLHEIRGDQGRITENGRDRWITISKEHRALLPEGGSLPAWDCGISGMFEMSSEAEQRRAEFSAKHFPLTYSADHSAANEAAGVIDRLKEVRSKTLQDAARIRRELASRVKHLKTSPVTEEEYERDVAEVSRIIKSETLKLERPQGSSLHHLRYYLENAEKSSLTNETIKFIGFDFQSMVIEHDWAQAFTTDDEGEVPMPFDYTCFEFRINGLRLLVLMGDAGEDGIVGIMCTGINGRWYVNADTFAFKNGKFSSRSTGDTFDLTTSTLGEKGWVERFLSLVGRQIRAVCIMLDAGVADADEQTPSIALNKKRIAGGKTPLKPYHIVRLGRRHVRAERSDATPTGRHTRLHVRRGHWRHFKDGSSGRDQYTDADGHLRSKTWINWMLVGQPDLGFVDKEYRL